MNILFCGDKNIEDGLLIATASLLAHTSEVLHITIFTMKISVADRQFSPVSGDTAAYLDAVVKRKDLQNSVALLDLSDRYQKELPEANLETRFTPYCMLRLFADEIAEIPDRLLYLDTDVVIRRDPGDFYHQNMEGIEFIGSLDYYGRFFFRNRPLHMDYINSGVLLLNMKKIRETGLFVKCRKACQTEKMFMPDQSALNKLAENKKIVSRKYNEQHKLHDDTVMQHFTTGFVFFPWPRTQTVKPWQIDAMHETLNLHEYDDILEEYQLMREELDRVRQ